MHQVLGQLAFFFFFFLMPHFCLPLLHIAAVDVAISFLLHPLGPIAYTEKEAYLEMEITAP